MNSIPSVSKDYGLNGGLLQVNAVSMDFRDVAKRKSVRTGLIEHGS
jgi:hypothetical protein